MRAIVGREGLDRPAASGSEMGRFETEWLSTEANLEALTDLSGAWIDRVHRRRPPDGVILDMDSSESPTHGEQEGSAWNGHFRRTCLPPAVRVQPVRRPRALRPAARQRPQRRRLAGLVAAGDRPLPWPGLRALLPRRRRLRQARAVRAARGRGHRLRHPAPGQFGPAGADRPPADPPWRPPAEEAASVLREFHLPGRELAEAAPGGGQGRVAPG